MPKKEVNYTTYGNDEHTSSGELCDMVKDVYIFVAF